MGKALAALKKTEFGEFEIIKALSILGLPFVHFIEEAGYECGYIAEYDEALFDGVIFLTVFGPAIFMMCMGARMQKEYSSKRLLANGLQFLLIGYLLNFVCFSIPDLIHAACYGVMDGEDNLLDVAVQDLFGGDIYVFVGWFFIFYGLIKKAWPKVTGFQMLCVSVVLLIINNYSGYYVDLPYNGFTQLIGNFVSVNDQSYFPLAGWMIFPVIGMLLRDYLTADHMATYHQRMTRVLLVGFFGLILVVAGLQVEEVSAYELLYDFTQTYAIDIFTALLLILLSFFCIGVISKIYYAVKENALERGLMKISAFIMAFYLIQWMLVALVTYYGFYNFYDVEECLSPVAATITVFGIWFLSLILTLKCGYGFLHFVLKITDVPRWFRKKKSVKAA